MCAYTAFQRESAGSRILEGPTRIFFTRFTR